MKPLPLKSVAERQKSRRSSVSWRRTGTDTAIHAAGVGVGLTDGQATALEIAASAPEVVMAAQSGIAGVAKATARGTILLESEEAAKQAVIAAARAGARAAAENPAEVAGATKAAGGGVAPKGSLTIDPAGTYSASEEAAAQHMADLGNEVTLRPPTGTRAGGGTSDLLVNGTRYDVYTPTTGNPDRIISAIAKKNSQAEGIVLDLSQASVTQAQLGDILRRVQGAGATNIQNIVIIGGG